MHKQPGFTLAELLIVLCILALIVGVVALLSGPYRAM